MIKCKIGIFSKWDYRTDDDASKKYGDIFENKCDVCVIIYCYFLIGIKHGKTL